MSSPESVLSQAKGTIDNSVSFALEQFQNNSFGTVRIVMRENEPWFVAKDVAACIEYDLSSVNKMCNLCRERDKYVASASDFDSDNLTESGNSRITLISESGLYRILAKCNLPKCEPFESWVFDEVLPSIRKTGKYSLSLPDFSDPAEAAIAWAREYREKQAAIVERDRAIRTKYLFVEGRDAEMCGRVGGLTNANERLREQIGDSTNWKQAKAIPWLRKYFDIRIKGFFGQLGKVLTSISETMGIKTRTVEDTSWGVVKAYHVSVISQLQSLLDAGEDILPKYRKWEQ